MCKFQNIDKLNIKFKTLLENDFKVIYIEQKESLKENNREEFKNDLSLFKIKKNKESIFKKISSIDTLNEVKQEIKSEYEKFTDDFLDYFERVDKQLDKKQVESFEIIEKIIKNRAKKLTSTIDKFKVEDSWSVSKLEEEFYFKLQKNLKDIVSSLVPTISTGMKENSAYNGILISLNDFLSQLGIYTMDLDVDKKYEDFHFLDPQECDDCETSDLNKQDIIKEILTYPYILDEERVVVEGKVILWKVIRNG